MESSKKARWMSSPSGFLAIVLQLTEKSEIVLKGVVVAYLLSGSVLRGSSGEEPGELQHARVRQMGRRWKPSGAFAPVRYSCFVSVVSLPKQASVKFMGEASVIRCSIQRYLR